MVVAVAPIGRSVVAIISVAVISVISVAVKWHIWNVFNAISVYDHTPDGSKDV